MATLPNPHDTPHFQHHAHPEEGPMTEAHAHGQGHDHHTPVDRPGSTTLGSSIWVALILIGLFVAAVNFIGVMSSGHHGEKGTLHDQQEATSTQTIKGEDGLGHDQPQPTQHAPAGPTTEQQNRGHAEPATGH